MVEPTIENLRNLGEEIAREKQEKFGSEHLHAAMDLIIAGPCYYVTTPEHPLPAGVEDDAVEVKIEKLFERAKIYRQFDKYLADTGQPGNREIDASIIRQRIWNEHKDEFFVAAKEIWTAQEEKKISRIVEDKADILKEVEEDKNDFKSVEEIQKILSLSLMCKTNGMFLGREVLNRDFTFFTHQPVFDFFVQKDPYKSIAKQDEKNKIRLLEMPRGSFKSVSDSIDCIQWIINKPDIRIMFLTSALDLAKSFVKEIKDYFTVLEDGDTTPFQRIFAADIRLERAKKNGEWVKLNFLLHEGDEGKETQFICPARMKGDARKKDVTIWAGSVGAGKVGKHCDLVKADDAVDEKNTDTPQLIVKTRKRIGMASKLVDPGGYKDNLGTPYAPNDWYNHIRNNVKDVLTLIRPCMWLKKDVNGFTAAQRGVAEKDFTENDWVLLFPQDKNGEPKLTHQQLAVNREEDPDGFPSQYMLDPYGYKKVSFSDALLQQQTIPKEMMPTQVEPFTHYVTWDFADTTNSTSDYSVGVVFAVGNDNRAYVVEISRDRYTFGDLCKEVARLNHEYKPVRVIIENARGAEKLRGDIVRASQDLGDKTINLDFVKVTNTKSAKSIRIGKLEPKFKNRQLYILNTVTCLQELITEFRDFGSAPHDDIPDAMGFCEHFLSDERSAPPDAGAALRAQHILDSKALNDMIYNSSPEDYLDRPLDPLPGTEEGGTGNDSAGDLWNPFGGPVPFKQ
jgi:predicted phage terminase large subunit-like protein